MRKTVRLAGSLQRSEPVVVRATGLPWVASVGPPPARVKDVSRSHNSIALGNPLVLSRGGNVTADGSNTAALVQPS